MAILKDLTVLSSVRCLQDLWAEGVTANKFVKNGGTASQFLKADGSVDSNIYATTSHTHSYVPLSGGTMSGKLTFNVGNAGYADSATSGGINMNNSNIVGVNAIFTADPAENAAEGIHFCRTYTTVDSLWASEGTLYFTPNRAIGTGTTAADSQKIWHSGNDGSGSGLDADTVDGKHAADLQLKLVGSGTGQNIKTINNTSILGSGNIAVQPTLVGSGTGQNIKTINNTSILGSGNIAVQPTLVGSGTGQNIKTINNTSILGSGNINVSDVFWATYGVTSFYDVNAAAAANKIIMVEYNNRVYMRNYGPWEVDGPLYFSCIEPWINPEGNDTHEKYNDIKIHHISVHEADTIADSWQYEEVKTPKIVAEKTFDPYTCTAANVEKGYIFFMNVLPTSDNWYKPWRVKYKLIVSTPENATQGEYDCEWSAAGTTSVTSYFNRFYSTSYYPIYYHLAAWYNTQAKFNNRETNPIKLGVRVYSARSATTLERTYTIKVLETENCTVSFPDEIETYDSVYTDAKYGYCSTYNATSVGLQESGDANTPNYYNYLYYNAYKIHGADTPLYRYKFCGFDAENRLVPITITDQTNATIVSKTACTVPMVVSRGLVLYNYSTNITSPTTNIGAGTLYTDTSNTYGLEPYNFNTAIGSAVQTDVYLVGNYNQSTDEFTLDTSSANSYYLYVPIPRTNALNTYFTKGKYYWHVGHHTYTSSYFNFFAHNPLFYFDGNNLIPIQAWLSPFNTINSTYDLYPSAKQKGVDGKIFDSPGCVMEGYAYDTSNAISSSFGAHMEGYTFESQGKQIINSNGAHVEGYCGSDASIVISSSNYSDGAHVEGFYSTDGNILVQADSPGIHIEGYVENSNINIDVPSPGAHIEGYIRNDSLKYTEGFGAHAEGCAVSSGSIIASGNGAHAEGCAESGSVSATGSGAHAEGYNTSAIGNGAHAEGGYTRVNGLYSHAEGGYEMYNTISSVSVLSGTMSTMVQEHTGTLYDYIINDDGSQWNDDIINKTGTILYEDRLLSKEITVISAVEYVSIYQYDEESGEDVEICGWVFNTTEQIPSKYIDSNIFFDGFVQETSDYDYETDQEIFTYTTIHGANPNTFNIINGDCAHAEGSGVSSSGYTSHAEGQRTIASGESSHAEGSGSCAWGYGAHAEGYNTRASGSYSHAEGYYTIASSDYSHTEGYYTTASGFYSHTEGYSTTASDDSSHAEGYDTKASGDSSHAEGYYTSASGWASHAEGRSTTASGQASHAEGYYTKASGSYSHTEGYETEAKNSNEYAGGKYNKSNTNTIHSVGIGNSNSNRKNAFEILDNGLIFVYGVNGYDGTNINKTKTGNSLQSALLAKGFTVSGSLFGWS